MHVIWLDRITEKTLEHYPETTVVLFGDNLKEKGLGGMAKMWRGHPKALGVPTKKEPANFKSSFFTDRELISNLSYIRNALKRIPKATTHVLAPRMIGRGRAMLPARAQKTYRGLIDLINALALPEAEESREVWRWTPLNSKPSSQS